MTAFSFTEVDTLSLSSMKLMAYKQRLDFSTSSL